MTRSSRIGTRGTAPATAAEDTGDPVNFMASAYERIGEPLNLHASGRAWFAAVAAQHPAPAGPGLVLGATAWLVALLRSRGHPVTVVDRSAVMLAQVAGDLPIPASDAALPVQY